MRRKSSKNNAASNVSHGNAEMRDIPSLSPKLDRDLGPVAPSVLNL